MALNNELIKKLENLTNFLKNKKLIVAFSGGVDSSLLAFLAKKYSIESLSVTIKTVFTTSQETTEAQDFASKYEIPHKRVLI
ncbi:MAG: asparagine synthase-related protein [Candidatus Lokiarchaeota archaeon]